MIGGTEYPLPADDATSQAVFPDWEVSEGCLTCRGFDMLKAFISFTEMIPTAVAALDESGRVHASNRRFGELIEDGDGLRLTRGKISAAAPDDAGKLDYGLSAVMHAPEYQEPSAQIFSIRRCGRTALNCAVVSARSVLRHAVSETTALLFVADPDFCPVQSVRSLCVLYHLTPAQTELALYLVRGFNSADIAAAMGLKEETIRAYLKHIYAKTETNRQSELVQLLLSGSLPLILPGKLHPVALGTQRGVRGSRNISRTGSGRGNV